MIGFVVGLVTGFGTLGVQRFYLPTVPGLDPDWINFQFGAYAIFINIAATVLAMGAWTLLERPEPAEEARIAAFFARMREPLETEAPRAADGRRAPSPFFITGLGVAAIGAMLLLVSAFTESVTGRWIDIAAGAVLVLLGALLYRTKEKTPPPPPRPLPELVETNPAPAAASTAGDA
jgi:hypothetical protein